MCVRLPAQVFVLMVEGSSHASVASMLAFAYAMHYLLIMLRMPDFLGHLTVQLLNDLEEYVEANMAQWLAWARFLFRIAYIVVMQLFFRLISQVSDAILCAVITVCVCAIVYLLREGKGRESERVCERE